MTHSECSHPKTKSARAACRKLRAQGQQNPSEKTGAKIQLIDERPHISKIVFHTFPCTRCGGTGYTTYTHIEGGRCFGCAGNGEKLSSKGKRAKAAYEEMMMEKSSKRLGDLKPGDTIRSTAYEGMNTYPLRMRKIEEIIPMRDDYTPVRAVSAKGTEREEHFETWQRDIRFVDGKMTHVTAPSREALDDVRIVVAPDKELTQQIFHEIVKRFAGATAE